MQLVQAGKEYSFEVTFDADDLDVAMSVYDDSSGSPVLVQGPTVMDNVVGNMYRAKFTPTAGKSYLIFKAVYTDGAFGTLDSNYPSGSESIRSENFGSNPKKNTALAAFPFQMFDEDGVPATGLTVTATRSIDGGSFAACTNSVSAIGNGWYKINLSAADLNGDTIALNFAATGALVTGLSFTTEAA